MTFDEYTRSLECVTTSHLPAADRIADAYRVGSNGKPPPAYLRDWAGSGHLWDRIRDAFELGQERR